jgi:hypothetical protein
MIGCDWKSGREICCTWKRKSCVNLEEFSNLGNDLKWPCSKQKIKCSLTYLVLNCKFKFPFIYLYKIQPYLQLQKDHNLYYYLIVEYPEF